MDAVSKESEEVDKQLFESNYKEKSHVNDYNIPSLEHCELFIVKLNEFLASVTNPILKNGFSQIKVFKKEKKSKKRKSDKKVIIKKRTLKGTELQKINIRNKSFSG